MLTISLLLAALLLILLYSRRTTYRSRALDLRAITLPSPSVVERIFSPDDATYSKSLPKQIRACFQRDRHMLAITWIRQIRELAILLSRDHVIAVRRNSSLQLRKELHIGFSFVSLLVSCELLALMVTAFGPVSARRLLTGVAASLRSLQAELHTSQLVGYNLA